MQGQVSRPSRDGSREEDPRQATPVELAAVLMDAVCRTTVQEKDSIEQLALTLDANAGRIVSELMYLRAFAVDLALEVELGDDSGRDYIMGHYSSHWARIDDQVPGTVTELSEHLDRYREAVRHPAGQGRLGESVGAMFADRCRVESGRSDLALFGAAMFTSLYDEVARLLADVELVLE